MRKQRQGPRLVRVVPQSDLEASVIALSKRHQKTLGQLPYEVFHEAALKGELANFKQPKQVFVVQDLPRNTMGKVQKALLRNQYAALFEPKG